MKPRFIDIDGRRYSWSYILELRKAQLLIAQEARQPALFELREDSRPSTEQTAASRYLEPSLFDR